MRRRSILNINNANVGKMETLDFVVVEMTRVVNLFIAELWSRQDFHSKFVNFKVDTWLSARLQQSLGKQAAEIVKSQRKRKKKTMPVFRGGAFNLDSRFVDFRYDDNTFDIWIRLSSIGKRIQLRLPSKAHKHYNKFKDWTKSKSIRLLKRPDGYYIEVFFEKDTPPKKQSGKTVGIDIGYKELIVTSDGESYDAGLENVYEKIARKRQGSKAFKRALVERDNLVGQSLNKFDLSNIREVVAEDLKGVKKGSKGRIRKSFNRKLQRWIYPKVLAKLSQMTEEAGVLFTKVNPTYTSQKCSSCGDVCKSNRQGKVYKCSCGNVMDADLNASINISHLGVYSPQASSRNV